MAQECRRRICRARTIRNLNEVPEHMAQEFGWRLQYRQLLATSMKFLSTWLRNRLVNARAR